MSKSTELYWESFFSDSQSILFWWTRSPRTPWTKSSFSVKIQFREDDIWMITTWRSKIGAMKFRIRIIRVTAWAWISKTTIIGSQSLGRSSSPRENTLVLWIGDEEPSSPGMLRKKLPRNWRIENTLLSRRKWSNSTKVELTFYAAWSGITNNSLELQKS